MELIDHPQELKEGIRILMRVSRNKDGAEKTHTCKWVTYDPKQWDAMIKKLAEEATPNQRIYASVESRDVSKAIREFKRLQLENDYADKPNAFYTDMKNRWISCLMSPRARKETLFMFDLDNDPDYVELTKELFHVNEMRIIDSYRTKSGWHLICTPFNYPKQISAKFHPMIHKNGMILVGY